MKKLIVLTLLFTVCGMWETNKACQGPAGYENANCAIQTSDGLTVCACPQGWAYMYRMDDPDRRWCVEQVGQECIYSGQQPQLGSGQIWCSECAIQHPGSIVAQFSPGDKTYCGLGATTLPSGTRSALRSIVPATTNWLGVNQPLPSSPVACPSFVAPQMPAQSTSQQAFWTALRSDDVQTVTTLLTNKSADPNSEDTFGNTALANAAARGYLDMVTLLICHGATVPDADACFWAGQQAEGNTVGNTQQIKNLICGPKLQQPVCPQEIKPVKPAKVTTKKQPVKEKKKPTEKKENRTSASD